MKALKNLKEVIIIEPLVSIITVSFNSENTIKDTIESVLNQKYSKIEYIIVDGNSIDNTLSIINSYVKEFKKKGINYIVISENDDGIYDAMNKGISISTGEIVGIINSDDWYEKQCVERVVDMYTKSKFDLLFANLRVITPHKNIIKKARLRHIITTRDWNHPTMFVNSRVYKKIKYKLESIYDDFDIYLRIRKADYKIVVLNEVLANFRFGGISNKKSIKSTFNRIRIKYKIYRNNGYSIFYWFDCFLVEMAKYILG